LVVFYQFIISNSNSYPILEEPYIVFYSSPDRQK